MQIIDPNRQTVSSQRSVVTDLALVVVFGLVAALAKRHLDFSLGIPGHAGVGWISVLIVGRIVNPRLGAAALTGVAMGLWAVPVGINHSLGYNVAIYGLAAATLEVPALRKVPLHTALGTAVAGVAIHLTKFGYAFGIALASGFVRNLNFVTFIPALRNHIIFGAAGGLLGWWLWRSGRYVSMRVGLGHVDPEV